MRPLAAYRRVLPYLAPYRREFALVIGVGLVASATSLAQPWLTRDLIDQALLRKDWSALVRVAVLLAAITVIGFVLNAASSYWYTKLSAGALFDMRLSLFRHLQTLSPAFFARTKMGDIVSRLNNDLGEVQRITADVLLSILSNVLFLAGSAAIMVWLDWRLFLVGVAVLPLSILAVRMYQNRLAARVGELRQRSADLGSFLIESLLGMRLVVAFAREDERVSEFGKLNRNFVDSLLRMQLTSYWASAIPGTLLTISTATVFLYGGRQVIDGHLSVGGLIAFLAYHARLLAPVQNLMSMYGNLVSGAVSLGRVSELLDKPAAVSERQDAVAAPVDGTLEFRDVCFRYERDLVLDGASFEIPAGQLSVLVGPSGAGKSTIADLASRFYDPESGAVVLGGRDLRELRLLDVRRTVAVVEQLPFLLHASIADNLRFAKPEATDAELRAVAEVACIDAWIARQAEGFKTIVGERGTALSAGERQRIALARALLRDPKVLILDEPTSALDAETERRFAAQLKATMKGRTLLVITHRPEFASIADHVFELRDGKVRQMAHADSSSSH